MLYSDSTRINKLTEYIQSGINPSTVFNYIYWISELIKAGLNDAYIEETKF